MHFDLDGLRPVLLVIDVQELFTQPDAPFANDGAGPMLTTLNAFMADCRGRDIPVVLSSYVLRAGSERCGPVARQSRCRCRTFQRRLEMALHRPPA